MAEGTPPLTEAQILQTLMKWRSRILAAAWLVLRDAHAAEDVFQNVALKALSTDVSFDAESALVSWAFITTRRNGIDWLRRQRREVVSLQAEVLDVLERDWQDRQVSTPESRIGALEDCLAAAPEDSRTLLRLRYFDGLDCRQVATRIGSSLDAVYKRLSRLHESLRQCMEAKLASAGPAGGATP